MLERLQYAEETIFYESSLFNRKLFNQQAETNHAFVLSFNKSFAYDTWNIELASYYNLTSEEYMIRPKISVNINDALSATFGGYYMTGPDQSIFKYSEPIMNGVFIELKASF